MAPVPQLPNIECFDCEEGNRFMKHIDTEVERVPALGPDIDLNYIAIFRCAKCRGLRREAFDPSQHPRT